MKTPVTVDEVRLRRGDFLGDAERQNLHRLGDGRRHGRTLSQYIEFCRGCKHAGGADFTLDALSLDVAPYQEEVITCTADAMDFQSHCLMEDWVRVYDVAEGVTMYVDGIISGPGGVVKRGSGTLVLAGSKDSCGDVYLNKGVLEFASDASWLNGTNVVVTGGTLRLTASEPFNRECVAMNISGGGKIELANGARQHVASLSFDGVPQAKKGSYGADKYPDYISGTGVLIIPGGGTLIIIK